MSQTKSNILDQVDYMRFPFAIGDHGAETSARRAHVRAQIEQVLFTLPGERWFRPEFGAGIRTLIFEPNNRPLWEVTKKRLEASLGEALAGEVLPESLEISVEGREEQLLIVIAYTLATINHTDRVEFLVKGAP